MQYQIVEKYHDDGKKYHIAQYRALGVWKTIETLNYPFGTTIARFNTRKEAIKALRKKAEEIRNRDRVGNIEVGKI